MVNLVELEREALKVPPELKPKKQKNVSYTPMHDKVGTVHVKAQNVEKITSTIVPAKALRKKGGGSKRKRDERSKSEEDGPRQRKKKQKETL
jgi:hypothetical protein